MHLQEDILVVWKALGALMCLGPGASEQGAAAGRARRLAQDAVLGVGQLLDQGPEVAKGDALSRAHAHFAQDFRETLVSADALAQVGQL